MSGWREDCCYVAKRHGAYLVSMGNTEQTEDAVPDEMYDCASSLSKAKRVAVEMARGFGYEGAVRWRDEGYALVLNMTASDDEED